MDPISKLTKFEKKISLHDKGLAKHLNKKLRLYTMVVGGALGCVLIALSAMNINQAMANTKNAYSVMVNDRSVAMLKTADEAQKAIDTYILKEGKKVDQDVYTKERLDVAKSTLTQDKSFKSVDEAAKLIAENVTPVVNATVISVNGKRQLYVGDKNIANTVLEKVKQCYIPNDSTLKVVDVKFHDKIQMGNVLISARKVMNADEAANYLVNGTDGTIATHAVADGENAWGIAHSHGMIANELAAANPGVNLDKLKIGQKLKLVSKKPVIQVATVLEKVAVNAIPYKTVYTKDRSAAAGTQTVSKEGKNGKEQVTLQLVRVNGSEVSRSRLNTVVLEAPVNQQVSKGAAIKIASRGGNGNRVAGYSGYSGGSSLLWPTTAHRISSYYGSRHGGFHTGLDIDGNTGDPVWAAASGTVTLAGWNGSYGYCVLIRHGNGLVTRYGHLSRIKVSVGQSVSKGQTIGLEGETGNATGSHLHFEVIVGGATKNPIPYIR